MRVNKETVTQVEKMKAQKGVSKGKFMWMSIAGLAAMLVADASWAGSGAATVMDNVINNLISPAITFLKYLAALAGLFYTVRGVMMFVSSNQPGSQVTKKDAIINVLVGGVLAAIIWVLGVVQGTLGTSSTTINVGGGIEIGTSSSSDSE